MYYHTFHPKTTQLWIAELINFRPLRNWQSLLLELSRYVQSETPKNLSFNDKALDLRSGA